MLLRFKHYRLLEEMNERQKKMHYDLHVIMHAVLKTTTNLSLEDQAKINAIYDRAKATTKKIDTALSEK